MKTKDALIGGGILAIVLLAAVFVGYNMSTTKQETGIVPEGQLPGGINTANVGNAATLELAAFDDEADTTTQVAVAAYYWIGDVFGGTKALLADQRVSIDEGVVGSNVKVVAFDSTYPYGDAESVVIATESQLLNLHVSAGSTSQNIKLFDENGDAITDPVGTGVDVGSANYVFDKLRIENLDDKSMWKVHLVGFDVAETTNINEVKVSGLTRFTGSIRTAGDKSVEDWYILDKNLNDDMTKFDTGSVTVVTNGNAVVNETMTIYVRDIAPYLDRSNVLAYGVEDDANSPSDVGIADKTQAISLN